MLKVGDRVKIPSLSSSFVGYITKIILDEHGNQETIMAENKMTNSSAQSPAKFFVKIDDGNLILKEML